MNNLWPFKRSEFDLLDKPPAVKYEGRNYIVDEFTPAERRKELFDHRFTDEIIDILNYDRISGMFGG